MTADHHLFWITSRAAGITALLLASLAVSAGLLMGGRLIRGRRAQDLRSLHEVLSLATLVALAVHGLSLLGDSYLRPSLADIAIPLHSNYHRWWTAAGIVGAWALALLGLSYYARRRIGTARWRSLHRFTALAWVLGVVHSLGEGSDAGRAWFLVMVALVVGPAGGLLAVRMTRRRSSPPLPAPRPVDRTKEPIRAPERIFTSYPA
ncbi:ferric reductase-like transmembrane domain-containing protein [Capillimicrobium parvum]|uniref:Ferric oxidoreductase domain-containing protein n=1 Tax=Capillimicrobium parvum TaxID=2884022 RepID=A0A9E6XV59_9ACTN|nr:ferric reductase-like transmembrane domain-containing protein [Capillimicrobium parvum]UGS34357.1 hypothetical protein DSM104329_00734 [Capillimicrobium parvum]